MAKLTMPKAARRKAPLPDEVGPNVSPPTEPQRHLAVEQGTTEGYQRIDGRSLRRTGRTVQFGTRVSPVFDTRLRELAQRDRISLAEVMERALLLYDQQTSSS